MGGRNLSIPLTADVIDSLVPNAKLMKPNSTL